MFQNVISCDNNNYNSNIKQNINFLNLIVATNCFLFSIKSFLEENFSSKSLALFGNFNYFWREWWWWKKCVEKRNKMFCVKKEGVSMYLVVERDRNSIQTQKMNRYNMYVHNIFFFLVSWVLISDENIEKDVGRLLLWLLNSCNNC